MTLRNAAGTGVAADPSARPGQVAPARRVPQLALFAVPIVVLLVGAWTHRTLFDDAFINLRVVDQVLHGHGPVFNHGQRVEAVTSPLWLWLLVVGAVLTPLKLEWLAVLLSLACSLVGVGLLMAGAARLLPERDRGRVRVPIGALALVSLAPFWIYSASGLENGLSTLWLGGVLLVLARWAAPRRLGLWGAALIGLGTLVRPEFAVFSGVFLVVVLAGERDLSWGRRAAVLAAAGALPAAYELFRMGYYGLLVPNTAITKSAEKSSWRAGGTYLMNLLRGNWLWVPLIVLAVGVLAPIVRGLRGSDDRAERRRMLVIVAFVAGALLEALFVVRVGGDYLPARLLLPALTALVAPIAVVAWDRRYGVALLVLPWSVVAVASLRTTADRLTFFGTTNKHPVTLADFNWNERAKLAHTYSRPGVYLNSTWIAPPPAGGPRLIVAEYGIGVPGYGLGVDTEVVDLLGLAEPIAAHLTLHRRGVNSHEKPMPMPWLVAQEIAPGTPYDPALLVTGPKQREPLMFYLNQLGHPVAPFPARVEAARVALGCAPLRRLVASYTAPLTLHLFASNVLHAPSLTRIAIPPEPRDAVAALCPRR